MKSVRSSLVKGPAKAPTGVNISLPKEAQKPLAQMEDRHRLVEEALRESEERYRILLDEIQDSAIFMMDPLGRIVSWNAGAERIKGYSADQIIGHNFSCFFPAEDIERGRPEEVLRMTAASGQHEEQSMRVRKDGSQFLARISLTALRDPTGNLRGFSEFAHDLSESTERRKTEEKYRTLFNSIDEGFCTIEVLFDASDKPIDHRFLEINPSYERQTGIQNAVGRTMLEIAPLHEVFWFETYGKVALTGEPARFEHFAAQLHRWFDVYAFRVGKPQERKLSILVRDITERKRAEEALRESEERYRMLLDGVQDYAIIMMDPLGRIVSWNAGAERIKGYSASQIIGRSFSCFFPAEDIERGRPEEILRMTAASGRYEEQGMRVRKDGSRFLARLAFTALRDSAGNLRGFSEFSHDLSESQESEAKYRGLLEAAPDAMLVVNQDGAIVLLNLQAEKQFGYRRDELLGQQVKNIIPRGFAERLAADGLRSAADALAQQIGTGIELTGRRKDGGEFPIEIMLSPLESDEGILVTAAIRDISVRKAAEENLAKMEGRYRGLLEAAPDAIVVVDPNGEIVLLNVQAENQFGYHRDELVGRPVKNIIPQGFAERLVADALRTPEAALAQQMGMGIELTGRRKSGSEFPIEIMLSPLDSAEGTLVTAAIRDISVRKDAEEHLAQMEGRYRGLLEAAPDAMVVVGQGGEIVLLNVQAEKQFGYRRDELLGQQVKNIIPQGFAERLHADGLRSAADALAQKIGTGIELTARRKDGTEFPIEIMLSPLESAEGILVTAAIRDISVRKASEAHLLEKVNELNRSNEELGQFAYVASHDLQEPLRMVASYTQLLSRRYKGKLGSDADEFIAFATDGASRMQRLIQDLLAYSRVATKGHELRNTSSEEALQQALLNLRSAIEESGALVTHDPLPAVLADETQLIQLFQNLVGNAIKYQRPGVPRVHISVTSNDREKWIFSVQDNGLGIDPQYFERIFGMFQRLHKRDEFAGTGIGLAICKKIVERHGGNIWVESQPGHGSTFRFELAAAPAGRS